MRGNEPNLVCIQETKQQSVHQKVCFAFWGDHLVEWSEILVINGKRGLLCLCGKSRLIAKQSYFGASFLGIRGRWSEQDQTITILNIYSPCAMEDKRHLWGELLDLK